MTDSPVKYHAIPASEDQAYESDVHQVRADELYSTSERSPAIVRTKWTYFFLGCAILLPWNVLINATSFFLSRLAGSPLYPTFSSWSSSVYTVMKLVSQFYSTYTLKQSSTSRRIFTSIITIIILFISLCLSTFIRGTPTTFFAFALLNTAVLGAAAGYMCTAVIAGAALLGTSFLQYVLSGQAASAVVVSAVQVASSIIALWEASPKSGLVGPPKTDGGDGRAEEMAARIFFGVSVMFLCITLVSYTWLTRQSFYKSVIGSLERYRRVEDPDERTGLVADDRGNLAREPGSRIYQVFRRNLIFMFSITYVFTVHLSVYPAITARVRSVDLGIHPMLFTAIHFLVMNTGDLLGRYSCLFPRLLVWSGRKILTMSLLRTLFVPVILLCNVDRPAAALVPPIIDSDIVFMIVILSMGYTTGYVSALALLAVSSLEHNPRLKGRRSDVDIAATLAGSCLVLGLALGALSSFGVQVMM